MKIIKSGEQFIHKLANGEGMLYQMSEDPINPFKLLKTLSPSKTKEMETS